MSRRQRRHRTNDKRAHPVRWDLIGLWLGLALALALALSIPLFSPSLRLEVGDISRRLVLAPRTVVYVDTQATERRRQEAGEAVAERYERVPRPTEIDIDEVFDHILAVANEITLPDVESKATRLEQELRIQLPAGLLITAVSSSPEVLEELRQQCKAVFRRVGGRDIHEDTDELLRARAEVDDLVQEAALQGWRAQMVAETVKQVLRPNLLADPQGTETLRQQAQAAVSPERAKVLKGETVLKPGDRVTQQQYDQLVALGLLRMRFDLAFFLQLFLLIALLLACLGYYLQRYQARLFSQPRRLTLTATILVLCALLYQLQAPAYGSLGVMAVIAAGMLVGLLMNLHIGLLAAFLMALLLGVVSLEGIGLSLQGALGAGVGVLATVRLSKRSHLLRAAALVTVTVALARLLLAGLEHTPVREAMIQMSWAVANALGSFVVLMAVVPVLERLFGVTTAFRLLELANPNEPLLRRLLAEAPGTYHASLVIGNLAEAAAEAVGADPLLTRAAAYYHDIGKILRPYCFVENQFGEANIHDRLAPAMSALVIRSHVKEGVEMAEEYGLPEEITDVIRQHHGTTMISFMYKQAVEQAVARGEDPSSIDEAQFRYEGPRPQFKEAGIIMLADAVEAAIRSMQKVTPQKIEKVVESIYRARLEEGQLDEADLTLQDLNVVKQAFIKNLQGIFHSRIEYPETSKAAGEGAADARRHPEPAEVVPAAPPAEARRASGAGG